LLKPGLFARVTIYTGALNDAVVAPLTALMYDNSTISIFVVEGNAAHERKVKTGGKYGEDIEITEVLKKRNRLS